jgi:hypothetical protein
MHAPSKNSPIRQAIELAQLILNDLLVTDPDELHEPLTWEETSLLNGLLMILVECEAVLHVCALLPSVALRTDLVANEIDRTQEKTRSAILGVLRDVPKIARKARDRDQIESWLGELRTIFPV